MRALQPNDRARAVYVVNVDGTGNRRLTPGSMNAGDGPDWSPDGKWILFRSHGNEDGKQSQIHVIHPGGTGLKRLTQFKRGTIVSSSTFSPDGKWIVVGASGVGGNGDLNVMRSDGSRMRAITRTTLWEGAPDWGPTR